MNTERLEAATVGGLLMNPAMMPIAETIIEPSDFDDPTWGLLFRTMADIDDGRVLDAATVVGDLRARGDHERVGGAAAIADAVNEFPLGSRVLDLVNAVAAAARARRGGEEVSE